MIAKSEDEMPQNTAFHQGLHCLVRKNRPLEKYVLYYTCSKLYNGPSLFEYIKLYRKCHWSKKVKCTVRCEI